MKALVIIGLLAMLLFLGALILLIVSGTNKSRNTKKAIIMCLAASILLGSFSVRGVIGAFNDLIHEDTKTRSGIEIYAHYFQQPESHCLRILHHAEVQFATENTGTWLHFKTCPEEFERISGQYLFGVHMDGLTTDWSGKPYTTDAWFRPEGLGEKIMELRFPGDQQPRIIIFTSADSTEAFMVDFYQ